jgi:glutamate-ammonia-ligase adenylyltransferase
MDDRKKAVESFQADHQRHTEMVHRTFRSFFFEPATSRVLKAKLRAIELKH